MSRPHKPIDWDKVDKLLLAGCSGTEIAPHFDIHVENFYLRVQEQYGMGFTGYSALKRQQGDSLLKAKQFEKAMKGDNTLLIWLGKTRLKQREHDSGETPQNDKSITELLKGLKGINASQSETDSKLPVFLLRRILSSSISFSSSGREGTFTSISLRPIFLSVRLR